MMIRPSAHNPGWSLLLPIVTLVVLIVAEIFKPFPGVTAVLAAIVVAGVVSAVHHAEVIAHKVGEPFGTLVLALAVTVIECSLIISMMMSGHGDVATLPRDTVFAGVMILLTGVIGVCLLAGGRRHHVQEFKLDGINAALGTLAAILAFTLILPNFTTTTPGPSYDRKQMLFIAIATLVLFAAFTFFQTVRHRDYFLPPGHDEEDTHADPPSGRDVVASSVLLLISLVCVVLGAETVSPTVELALENVGAPAGTVGILIAAIVLLPEGVAAVRSAHANRLQTSLNLAVGSTIATIGLTIPTVTLISLYKGWSLSMGLPPMGMVLLMVTLFITSISLRTGRTSILPGIVHLVLFAAYLFLSFVP
ncbi:Ca2+/H+ antiporter [Lysobacter silvestris]|uniref:Ca2+/H+ antiporter n=2 Tax=Solilutibacter silvestris TaxID=1645665 RepID=A0A2K1PZI8_9GAMM|nr:Ca2+/H+ antiporter [Lysobacter silvestris]